MAHAEEPFRNEIHQSSKSYFPYSPDRTQKLFEEGLRRASQVEQDYYKKLDQRDQDYFDIEAMLDFADNQTQKVVNLRKERK